VGRSPDLIPAPLEANPVGGITLVDGREDRCSARSPGVRRLAYDQIFASKSNCLVVCRDPGAATTATWLIVLTGWRRGEVLGMRWSEIDLPRRTARPTDAKTGASLRPLSEVACLVIRSRPRIGDILFASRSGERPIVGYRKMWLRIAKLGDLPSDLTSHVLRHSFASPSADLGYNEPTIASLLGHKPHSITSRYMHSADAVLVAAAYAVANATMELMASDQAQPQLRDQQRGASVVWDGITSFIGVFVTHGFGRYPTSAINRVRPTRRMASALLASSNLG
jgi:hypothetical protein